MARQHCCERCHRSRREVRACTRMPTWRRSRLSHRQATSTGRWTLALIGGASIDEAATLPAASLEYLQANAFSRASKPPRKRLLVILGWRSRRVSVVQFGEGLDTHDASLPTVTAVLLRLARFGVRRSSFRQIRTNARVTTPTDLSAAAAKPCSFTRSGSRTASAIGCGVDTSSAPSLDSSAFVGPGRSSRIRSALRDRCAVLVPPPRLRPRPSSAPGADDAWLISNCTPGKGCAVGGAPNRARWPLSRPCDQQLGPALLLSNSHCSVWRTASSSPTRTSSRLRHFTIVEHVVGGADARD